MHLASPCATTLEAGDVLVTDVAYRPNPRSLEHEHEHAFVATVLAGTIEKHLGVLSFSVPASGVYAMPAGVLHVDGFPTGVRVVVVELKPSAELWEPCATLLARVRRLRGPQLATIGRQLAVELRARDDLRPIAIEGLSLELLAGAARSIVDANGERNAPAWLNTVDEFLIESFFRPLRIAEVAALVHVHPAHLARVFRAHHGETIGHRIRRLRLDWAVGQLVEGELPLREIASRAGFADQSHFGRVFKQHTGFSPADYRQRRR